MASYNMCVPNLAFQLIEADIQFNCISNTTLSLNVNTRHGISQSTEQSDPFYGSILRSVNFESTHQLPCINLLHVRSTIPAWVLRINVTVRVFVEAPVYACPTIPRLAQCLLTPSSETVNVTNRRRPQLRIS